MTVAAHLSSVYAAAPIILWVEDVVTRDYLGKVWGDPPEIAFFVAGNNEAVRLAVDAARRENIGHVYGVVDRDFGRENKAKWGNPATDRFYLPRHEVENYALDAEAVFSCSLHNKTRTVPEIDAELHRLASQQPAWLSCRRVLTEIRKDTQGDFPAHPNVTDVPSVAEAESHITTATWFTQLSTRATRWTTAGHVLSCLNVAEADYNTSLGSGDWVAEFSGKEIFRQIRDYTYQPRVRSSHDSDYAKAIGEWQRANGKVHSDLTELRTALRAKVGLP